jgi:hypothetical protein
MFELEGVRFYEIDGCINCNAYKRWKDRHKEPHPKPQLHEVRASCLLHGCINYGHDIMKPYIGNHEIEYVIEHKAFPSGDPVSDEMIENCKALLNARLTSPLNILFDDKEGDV